MFGSDSFPLGPNGQFPKQRISSFDKTLPDVEEVYDESGMAALPVRERDFHSSLDRVKGRMKVGRMMREGQDERKFTPRVKKKFMQTGPWERQGGY